VPIVKYTEFRGQKEVAEATEQPVATVCTLKTQPKILPVENCGDYHSLLATAAVNNSHSHQVPLKGGNSEEQEGAIASVVKSPKASGRAWQTSAAYIKSPQSSPQEVQEARRIAAASHRSPPEAPKNKDTIVSETEKKRKTIRLPL